MKKAALKFAEIDEITEYNQQKVLAAFIHNRVSEADFAGSTGYGYGDRVGKSSTASMPRRSVRRTP